MSEQVINETTMYQDWKYGLKPINERHPIKYLYYLRYGSVNSRKHSTQNFVSQET